MLATAYLLARPSKSGDGGRGADLLTSYKLKCITPPAMWRPCPEKLAEAP